MSVISVVEAVQPDQLLQVAALLRDYLLWMRRRYRKHGDMLDLYFDEAEWESERADLAGHYGAPFGAIVLALVDGIPAGCVVIRGLAGDVCEMKRLFVRPAFQRMGIARAMVGKLARLARARGYARMRLETGALQTEALSLYASLGFERTAPYYACPDWFAVYGRFLEANVDAIVARTAPKLRTVEGMWAEGRPLYKRTHSEMTPNVSNTANNPASAA
jgi:ribosomal protein S18 acetylase RimI-like enzyme